MKKTLLAIGLSVLLFSCKKTTTTNFTATDMTGNATLSGKITKVILAQNAGTGYSNVTIPAAGVEVSVRILNSQLYPNSPTAQGSLVYNATTDANGNYNISLKANGNGSTGTITVNDYVGTKDTILLGNITKTGPYNTFGGTTLTKTFVKGQDQTFTYTMIGTPLVVNPNQPPVIGTAVVTGSVFINFFKQTGPTTYVIAPYTLPNYPVTLKLDKDPTTQMIRTYSGMTDANGIYSFTVQTTDIGTPGFVQTATVSVNDYAATQDTIKTGNIRVTGKSGVYAGTFNTVAGVTNTKIKNQINMTYNAFTPN
jgi:hypothetical protein